MTRRTPSITALHSGDGMMLETMDFGARLCRLRIPLADGYRDVALGYPQPADYLHDPFYLGACIGRHAGRIGGAQISIDGHMYTLNKNEPDRNTCLHGGERGFSQCFWQANTQNAQSIEYTLTSNDQDQGFPGKLTCSIQYTLIQDGELVIEFNAVSNKRTVLNLTHHGYYNLDGHTQPGSVNGLSIDRSTERTTIENHRLRVPLSHYLPLNAQMLPRGELETIQNIGITPNAFQRLGDLLKQSTPQFAQTHGIDHYLLSAPTSRALQKSPLNHHQIQPVATLESEDQRVRMTVQTSHPGVHVYTGNFLSSPWSPHQGICFEVQGLPNDVQQPNLPDNLLHAGEQYSHTLRLKFTGD